MKFSYVAVLTLVLVLQSSITSSCNEESSKPNLLSKTGEVINLKKAYNTLLKWKTWLTSNPGVSVNTVKQSHMNQHNKNKQPEGNQIKTNVGSLKEALDSSMGILSIIGI